MSTDCDVTIAKRFSHIQDIIIQAGNNTINDVQRNIY